MKSMEAPSGSGQWPDPSLVVANSFESKSPASSPARSYYTYRTPGLSISRSFDKETYINTYPSSPTSAFHMPEVRPKVYATRLCKLDDGSETSDTTVSKETGEQHNEECEVEVVAMDTSEVVVAQDGAVGSCDVVEKHTEDNKSTNSEVQVPDRQKSAMQAFLASPTSLNWDDLVRSMREEMFVKTITIKQNKSDDSSSIGSLGSSKGDNKSTGSMNSSLSSKSAFLKSARGRAKGKGGPGRRSGRKKESLEKKVERVLSSGDRTKKNYQDESHPLLARGKALGGKRCAFSAVTKLPSIPCSPNTPLGENSTNLFSPPKIERETLFNLVKPSPTPIEYEVVAPQPIETLKRAQVPSPKVRSQTQQIKSRTPSNLTPAEDPPLLLKMSISADSDEDSFYYHIRGKPDKAVSPGRPKSSSTKVKGHKNPYAFSNHPLLPAVVEEGNIPPFPTTFDELDSSDIPSSHDEEDSMQPEIGGAALGSFAASIEPTSSMARLHMYKYPSRRSRRRSFWKILAPCCMRTKAEV
ncbi:hypothetical protein ACHAWO_003856 [Cyclotella atomus]|uniref:Uncharacterized protein n=1 Tax=Cyclotella atomus TaxID=382360 RepID=A0ABD3QNG4_9STRA